MSGISIEQAHKLLGLRPQRALKKEEIQQAYLLAAKRYHPDSRYPDSTPCAANFRCCQDARHTLIRYYGNPAINLRKARRNQVVDLSPAQRHWKYKKYTMGLKAMVLFLVACEGAIDGFKNKKETRR